MPTLPSLDQGWGRGIRHTYDPAPVRLPSRQTPAHPPNASATAQAHDQKASEPPQHPPHASPPNGRQSSCQTPALPPSAYLPAERQPSCRTPAFLPNASATAQAHDRKASEPIRGRPRAGVLAGVHPHYLRITPWRRGRRAGRPSPRPVSGGAPRPSWSSVNRPGRRRAVPVRAGRAAPPPVAG